MEIALLDFIYGRNPNWPKETLEIKEGELYPLSVEVEIVEFQMPSITVLGQRNIVKKGELKRLARIVEEPEEKKPDSEFDRFLVCGPAKKSKDKTNLIARAVAKRAIRDKEGKVIGQESFANREMITGHPDRNWEEDLPHENGNYINLCGGCQKYFQGHKRRVRCKQCQTVPDSEVEDQEELWRSAIDRISQLIDSDDPKVMTVPEIMKDFSITRIKQ